jgi:hypothetical protein
MTLLRSWLTPEQTEQFNLDHEFDVIGCDTGTFASRSAGN